MRIQVSPETGEIMRMRTQLIPGSPFPLPPLSLGTRLGKYDPEWEAEFPWVYRTDDCSGTYCRLCKCFNTRNEQNRAATFNSTPCISLRKDVIRRHAGSSMPKAAVLLQCERLASEKTGGIVQAFNEAALTERKAALGVMKCLYWLAKMKSLILQSMFHCSNFP